MVEGVSYRLLILTAFVIVIGVVGAFVIVLTFSYLFASLGLFFYALMALVVFSAFVAYSLYVGLRKRNWVILTVMFTILGALLFASSTVAALPYSTVQTYPTQRSVNIFNQTFSIGPDETRTFERNGFPQASTNSSLVQIRISSTSQFLSVQFFTTERSWEWDNGFDQLVPALNFTYPGHDMYGVEWRSYYWTPSGPILEKYAGARYDWSIVNNFAVIFHNLENSSAEVQMQTDIFYKTDGQVETINYRPLIDFRFAYAGIGLIGIATVIEGFPLLRKKKQGTAELASKQDATYRECDAR